MASESSKAVILLVSALGHDGLTLLKKKLKELAKIFSISQCSSVYLVQSLHEGGSHVHDLRTHNLFSGHLLAIKGFSALSMEELSQAIQKLSEPNNNAAQHEFGISILCFGQETKMTPELTVPDADFHLFPEKILPAAEISPEFMHPVLRKSLREIASELPNSKWGEFVAQGKAMLDF